MNVDRPRQLDGEGTAARPSDVVELTRFLLHAAQQTGASLVSIGAVGPAISFGDDGAGWTKAGFIADFSERKLRQRLATLAGEKVQITSSHAEEAWTTGLIAVADLEKAQHANLQLPITGTTIVFQVGRPIRDFDKLVQQARGSMSLEVKLNGRTIKLLPPSIGAHWPHSTVPGSQPDLPRAGYLGRDPFRFDQGLPEARSCHCATISRNTDKTETQTEGG